MAHEGVQVDHRHDYSVPVLRVPMGLDRNGRVTRPLTGVECCRRAEEINEGARCAHCNREILDEDNTESVRGEASEARVHDWCLSEFVKARPDWTDVAALKVPVNHVIQNGNGDRVLVKVEGKKPVMLGRRK